MKRIRQHPFFIRLSHWEYWPSHAVYAVVYPYWFWLCLKARSAFFFSRSNPSIKNGGLLMESKKEIYDLIPQQYYPRTAFFKQGTAVAEVLHCLNQNEYSYPLIGKPDIGMKGLAVQKLNNPEELHRYVQASRVDFLIQEFIPYAYEAGIFYYRFPGEERGHISGIVWKEFLQVKGDGRSTIEELLYRDQRFILQMKNLKKAYGSQLQTILPKDQERILVPYGNHARGAKFVDASHLADAELLHTIDGVCRQIKGFYFGRLDVRFHDWDDLKKGRNFSIVEVNGAGSEPTHIYDPRHSIFFAWKEIIRHWDILYRISKQNRTSVPVAPYAGILSCVHMFRENYRYVRRLNEQQLH